MTKVAFACPLYDMKNHFELGLNLYKSRIDKGIKDDLYFIFSDIEQKDKFKELIDRNSESKDFKYLITTDEVNRYKAKAVAKKFFALEKLMYDYEFIILTDCESVFINNPDFYELAKYIWDNRTMLNSNKSPDGYFIMRKCFDTMGLLHSTKLRKDTKNYTYNFWFNDLQVYKCSFLPDFFEWLGKHNKDKVYDEKFCFEYYVFYAYLLLEHNIHIKKFNYESMGGINEYLYRFNIKEQEEIIKNMDLHWSSSKDAVNENTAMLFHLDRDENANYGKNDKDTMKRIKIQKIKYQLIDFLHFSN